MQHDDKPELRWCHPVEAEAEVLRLEKEFADQVRGYSYRIRIVNAIGSYPPVADYAINPKDKSHRDFLAKSWVPSIINSSATRNPAVSDSMWPPCLTRDAHW